MKKRLHTPLEEGEIKQLRLRDIVYLSGEVYTAKDKAHQRIIAAGHTTSARMEEEAPKVIEKL